MSVIDEGNYKSKARGWAFLQQNIILTKSINWQFLTHKMCKNINWILELTQVHILNTSNQFSVLRLYVSKKDSKFMLHEISAILTVFEIRKNIS